MKLGKTGWLSELLRAEISAHASDDARRLDASNAGGSARARARAWLRRSVHESGLSFGTPRAVQVDSGGSPEEVLFLAVVRTLARLALDLAVLTHAPPGPRDEQLLVLLATMTGHFSEAEQMARAIAPPTHHPVPKRLWTKVEGALEARAMSLAADPAYGLVLHNGAVYVTALTFGLQAIDLFARGSFRRDAAERRFAWGARQTALLVEVLTGLSCAEREPSYPTRRAILRQIDDLHLPAGLTRRLKARVKRSFDRRPSTRELVAGIRGEATRRFLLEQSVLAARVDGRVGPEERAFLSSLAEDLGFDGDELRRVEVEVAEFYARNRSLVDVFTVSAAAGVMGEELVDSMQNTLEKNFQRLMTEIRETGELSVLLSRAARGHSLSAAERRAMRAQLVDVAKAIPALAIFAAPGGVLLLVALAKVLPFSLLPSAFQDDPDAEPDASAETTRPPPQKA